MKIPKPLFTIPLALAAVAVLLLAACQANPPAEPQVSRLAVGLLNPIGLAELPDGGILVAEEGTGQDDFSAGVSLITPAGEVGRFISGMPSGRDSGDLSGTPFVALHPTENTLFTAHFNLGQVWAYSFDEPPTLGIPLRPDVMAPRLERLNNVALINPFDMTFDPAGVPVVTDASGNGVATENRDGTVHFFHRFAPIEVNGSTIDPVPTGITRVGSEYFVTLTGGCPYPAGSGRLVAIDQNRNERVVVDGLNMPIDVAQDEDGTIWLLEFARFTPDASCFTGSGYQADTGRLSRLRPDGSLETVVDGLNFPGALLPRADGSLLVSLVFDGEIVEIRWPERNTGLFSRFARQESAPALPPDVAIGEPVYNAIDDVDAALAAVIREHDLQPFPGASQQLAQDTPLSQLGQQLFFDPILSGDRNISCATCHHPALGMGDGRPLPIGTGGEGLGPQRQFVEQVLLDEQVRGASGTIGNPFLGDFVPRNSPTILNSALLPIQFWDGRVAGYGPNTAVATLDEQVNARALDDPLTVQALFPVTSLHEMAGVTLGYLPPEAIRRELTERLAEIPAYAAQFEALFGRSQPDITDVAAALAAFERRFIFTQSPWDDYLAGERTALDEQQKRGALLFYGALNSQVNCAACHGGDLFTDLDFHNLLVPQLGPGKGHGENGREDWGRAGVTFDARDRYRFRTPSLRNVELTPPYFHSGAYETLEDTIRHHANIWDAAAGYDPGEHVPPAFFSSVRPFVADVQGVTAAPALAGGLPLSDQDVADIVAFLHGLTDPAARELRDFTPDRVPSGLPVDGWSEEVAVQYDARLGAVGNAAGTARRAAVEEPPAAGPTPLRFVDVTAAAGLDFEHGAFKTAIFDDPAAMMGGGLCWVDFDRDGWLDLYLVNSYAEEERSFWLENGGLPQNKLFRNERGTFRDVTAGSGADLTLRGNGCLAADFDLDGWTDLFITADGPNALLWNQGDGTFREGAAAARVDAPEWNSAAAAGDLDLDGWPDLFVAAYIDLDNQIPNPSGAFPQDYYGLPDRVYLNNGDGTFREVSREAGLTREERGLGALLSDLDQDGRLELYIANDGQPNRMYRAGIRAETGDFYFEDLSLTAEIGDSGSGMGVAGGDYDGDGHIDLFVTNWEAELNALYRNLWGEEQGELRFRYSTYRIGLSGLGNNMTGWGTTLADFDHDGDVDLVVANGRVPVSNFSADAELVRFYGSLAVEGKPGQLREWTRDVGLHEDGVGPLLARGSAAADFDNDGDLDLALNVIGGPAVLLENQGVEGGWLLVAFDQFVPGARVVARLPDGRELVREVYAGSSYLATEDPRLHFGLGSAVAVAELEIRWPDGGVTTLSDVKPNQLVVVEVPRQRPD